MHTTKILNSEDFKYTIDGHSGSLTDIVPGFDTNDRIGIVVSQEGSIIGASTFLMAAVTFFYDAYRHKLKDDSEKFRIYPDYFVFHTGYRQMNHAALEIWPSHKEVVVENDPEKILEAINDRGITRLLVEDNPSLSATFLRETVSSADRRISTMLAYSPDGRMKQNNIIVESNLKTERFVRSAVNRSDNLDKKKRQQLIQKRSLLTSNGSVQESFRQINLPEALLMLTGSSPVIDSTSGFPKESAITFNR